ncbi:MAG: hypothetical protein KKG33_01945 [candidate division Zixibacteria bacterium]|nr:hypothetical protein [candidate division Zixibacteria bacterium]MBU1469242.1 hypothetical protein [candidate division Zixibacteria bacterium]MBU2624302.1 hypothetical protein [candidate division Zixibacteria bacterium]
MSGAVAASSGAVAAAIAAAAAEQRRKEEEEMTSYNGNDLKGWEFKIVRACTRKFKTAEAVQKLCQEESKAGWELVEKFDDTRIRFKRRIEKRAGDRHLDIDPYRTQVSSVNATLLAVVLGILVLIGGSIGVFVAISR